MRKIYWKEVIKEDREQEFLKSTLNEDIIPLLEFVEELTINLLDYNTQEKIEAYIPKKDIEDFLNNND